MDDPLPRSDAGHAAGPDPPAEGDEHGSPDASLGGYFSEHDRPPAFEGSDGEPYTVSIETEKTPDLAAPWVAYLVFPRWATTGLGIVDHVETPVLARGTSQSDVRGRIEALPLLEVKRLLDAAIDRRDPG